MRPIVGLVRGVHAGPTIAVTAIAVILGASVGLPSLRIVVLGAAVLAGHASIGWSNDWLDADRDVAAGRTDKPVSSGMVTSGTMRTAAIVAMLACIPLSLLVSIPSGIAHIVFVAIAWGYNVWLKRTLLSWLPYALAFGLLPSVVTLAAGDLARFAPWWAAATGALLGIAAHFVNVLPDLADDARTGVRGLPHAMGARAATAVAIGTLVAASVVVVVGPGSPTTIGWIGLVVNLLIAAASATIAFARPPTRLLFNLIIASAVIDVVLLALSGSRLLS